MDQDTIFKNLPSPLELSEAMAKVGEQSQALIAQFMEGQGQTDLSRVDPLGLLPAFSAFVQQLARDPSRLVEAQIEAWNAYLQVWQHTAQRLFGLGAAATGSTTKDRRFKDEDWERNPFFDYVRQTYLVTAQLLQGLVNGADGLDEKTARKVAFYTQQYIDALAPTNFAMTNPQVLHATNLRMRRGWR